MNDVAPKYRSAHDVGPRWVGLEALEPRILLSGYVVDSLADDGGGAATTLREAIESANLAAGADTITFDPALFSAGGGTITLGGTQLEITDDLTITGPGVDLLAVYANTASRVFRLRPGVTAFLDSLTISGGVASFDDGGGIYNEGDLTLTACAVTQNGADKYGGGIYSTTTSSLTIHNSTFTHNESDRDGNLTGGGGAIWSEGDLDISDTTLSDNTAGLSGGGLYSAGTASLRNCIVQNNTTHRNAGGIYSTAGMTIEDCTISGNRAEGLAGGIFSNAPLNITNSTIASNHADTNSSGGDGLGGGMYTDYSTADVTISGGVIRDNTTTGEGGGIHNRGRLRIIGVRISGNTAALGGGVYNYYSDWLTLDRCDVSENEATSSGGGVCNYGTFYSYDTTIADNASTYSGGGVFNGSGRNTTLIGSTVSDNAAGYDGGGIFSEGAVFLANSTLSGNSSDTRGGGLYAAGDQPNTLRNVTITGNRANAANTGPSTDRGGGIYSSVHSGGLIAMHNTIVAGNFFGPGSAVDDVHGQFVAIGSHNLIGAVDGSTELAAGPGTLSGVAGAPLNPMIGPLVDNGGATLTHKLLPASPAIDTGDGAQALDHHDQPLATDQRGVGFERIFSLGVDIGSVEGSGGGAAVAGSVWFDQNADAVWDIEEIGFDNVVLELYTDDGDGQFEPGAGDTLLTTRPTADGGTYRFAGLLPGEYWVRVDGDAQVLGGYARTVGTDLLLVSLSADDQYAVPDLGYDLAPTVSTLTDGVDGDISPGQLSLREAIQLANANPGLDMITFAAELFASGPGTITLGGTQLTIDDDVTLVGPGANLLTVNGDAQSTVIRVESDTAADIGHLTVTNGRGGIMNMGDLFLSHATVTGNVSPGGGGGIFSFFGKLEVFECVISQNTAEEGGGLYTYGTTIIERSTIADNHATADAGGMRCNPGDITIISSMISGNTANTIAGGLYNQGGTMRVGSSTIVNNTAKMRGGGVYSTGTLLLTNATVVDNRANSDGVGSSNESGGGICSWSAQTTIHNSIIAGNVRGGGGDSGHDVYSTGSPFDVVSSYNLIGLIEGSTGLDGTGTLYGTTGAPLDPLFEPLDNYGGPTLSYALRPDSPAVDAGNNDQVYAFPLTTDQRGLGFPRILGAGVDIGAFERRSGDSAIGDIIWNDRNEDGLQDPGEEGIASVPMTLYLDDGDGVFEGGTDDSLAAIRSSIADGTYGFEGLGSGSYWVSVDQTAAPLDGFLLTTSSEPLLVAVTDDQQVTDADFGYYRPIIVDADNDEGADTDGRLCLREALALAEAEPGYNIIQFAPDLAGATISLTAALGQLLLDSDLEIRGLGRDELVIDSGTNSRGFFVDRGVTAVVSDLTVTGGQANRGGGIYVDEAAVVNLSGVAVTANSASVNGGGIFADLDSSLTMVDCLIRDNEANNQGGGIYVGGTLTLMRSAVIANSAVSDLTGRGKGGGIYISGGLDAVNTTISSNESSFRGGGVYADIGTMLLTNVTVSGNLADSSQSGAGRGGGIYNDFPVMTLHNTIVAGNTLGSGAPDDVSGPFQAAGSYNLIGTGDGSFGLIDEVNGNRIGSGSALIDPRLMPLGDYGGTAPTYALRIDSPAIDAGDNTVANSAGIVADQRGMERFVDHDGGGGVTVDIGAYEAAAPILVDSLLDEAVDTDGMISLREALAQAYAAPGFDVVRFDGSLAIGGAGTLVLTLGELLIDSDVDIQGFDADKLTIDGNSAGRVFRVEAGVNAWMSNLTITGGAAQDGGGIYNVGSLSLSGVTLSGNSAVLDGGAVHNAGTLTAANSTISGNAAGRDGGGVYSDGTTSLTNVTILNNTADSDDDAVGSGGGMHVVSGNAVVHNTVIAGNFRGSAAPVDDDAAGQFDPASSYNLIGVIDGSIGLDVALGSQYGQIGSPMDPMLGDLADNGGPTQTHAIQAGSPVIDAGSNALAGAAGLTADQRGEDRFKDALDDGIARVDIGAFEQQFRLNLAPTLTTVDTLRGAVEDQDFVIDYDALLTASNAADLDGDPISFRIESLGVGAMTLDSTPIVPGVTLLGPGQSLTWTPPADLAGEVTGVFSVRAFDGWAYSELPAVDVTIEIAATADPVNYAVLFSGGVSPDRNYLRYYNNVRDMHQTLVNAYGLEPHNIYVLYADGTDPGVDRPDGQNSDMSFAPSENVLSATNANLAATLSLMASSIDANDHFMFWTFDHGVGSSNQTTLDEEVLNGWGELIEDQDIAAWLAPIDTGYRSYIFNQCFSGGILDNLAITAGSNRFGAASSTHYEVSYGDAFVSAFTEALQAGYRYTHDAYRYALTHDHYASDGEGPGGDRVSGVEHPWSVGDNFPIFAITESTNSDPLFTEVLPLKVVGGDYDPGTNRYSLDITYDMLIAAGDAIDPDGDAIVFRIESLAIGSMTSGGVGIVPGVTELRYGESLVWTSPENPTGTLNAFTVVVTDGPAAASGPVVAPIRIDPVGDIEALGDSFTIQQNSTDVYVDVLANDTIAPDGGTRSVGVAAHGTVELVGGQVRYTPAADFTGFDVFHYVIEDSTGSTDIAAVSVHVVDYDPSSVSGSFSYEITELSAPRGWLGLPEQWGAAYLNSLPDWTSSRGLDIREDGYVLIGIAREDYGSDDLWYRGGTRASYMWHPDLDVPDWADLVEIDGVVASSSNIDVLMYETDIPIPDDTEGRLIVYGAEAASIDHSERIPCIVFRDPDNALEAYLVGAVVEGVGPYEMWHELEEAEILPRDIGDNGKLVGDYDDGFIGEYAHTLVYNAASGLYEIEETIGGFGPENSGQAINTHGHVVGSVEYGFDGDVLYQAFFYDGIQMTAIGLPGIDTQSRAFGINANDQVVGASDVAPFIFNSSEDEDPHGHAFFWDRVDGITVTLDALPGYQYSVA